MQSYIKYQTKPNMPTYSYVSLYTDVLESSCVYPHDYMNEFYTRVHRSRKF